MSAEVITMKKRIAVIGGGFAGIGALMCLKELGVFEPVCFEKTSNHGGTWCYRESSSDGVPSIMPTTVINNSKEMGAFSNYPPRKEFNNFMKHHELYQYISDLAAEKDILRFIQLNTEVMLVKRSSDYEKSGKWVVTVRNTVTEEVTSDVYDGVMVCTGHFNRPKLPTYPGQSTFKGQTLHSHSLRGVSSFQNKTVVVVGMSCSGLDAAVEISNVAKQVYVSTRSGAHVISRVGPNGYPYDYFLIRRYRLGLMEYLPWSFVTWLFETFYLDPQFSHKLYTIQPKHRMLQKDPVLNDHMASKVLSGSIIMKPDIQYFTEDGVIFEGDSEVTQVDVVIMATGYTWKFPFLEEGLLIQEENRVNLYKCMFPPHLPHATLIFIGFFLPFGPGFPPGELQCRWAAQVLAGNCKLPSQELMHNDTRKRHEKNLKRYIPTDKISIRVNMIQYCDDIASQFGAKPNFLKILLTDPRLFSKLIFGPFLSYQFRLQGPYAWEGARDAIMTCEERIFYPLTKGQSNVFDESLFIKFIKRIVRVIFP
ncbi:dimethylaniline monooxygenase 2 [Nephila pilipes]|uniref:Flavin-containing monooxygenase n=1 Tax=Nephila pilipes TaxID=299642 RepID=A0A8X6IMV3_NEPPI|nr:dimethylaniline monooxygenase 2 [Nephila pilipes]GFT57750.1 dimethylaniline monooxygenase 2 [Nephila pilipes]